MSQKQYVIISEGNRKCGRDGGNPDSLLMMDPEEVQYRRDFLGRKLEVVDHVKAYSKSRHHAFTVSGVLYHVSPSCKLHPICSIGPG